MKASVPPETVQIRRPTPEDTAAVKALGAALRARKPIPEIRRLFEYDDRDARTSAAGQFCPIDPEWASATMKGLFTKLPTREVLAHIQRP